MRRVEIQAAHTALTLLACSRCETSAWLANGVKVDRAQLLGAMSAVGRAPRV